MIVPERTEALQPSTARQGPSAGYASAPLPFDPILIAAGARVALLSLARRIFGWKRYPGSVEAICRAAIDDCWTGQFFAGSAGHFHQFWTRDLAMCTGALFRLGHREKGLSSWNWGLVRFASSRPFPAPLLFLRLPPGA